jgi:hypothetical protein
MVEAAASHSPTVTAGTEEEVFDVVVIGGGGAMNAGT